MKKILLSFVTVGLMACSQEASTPKTSPKVETSEIATPQSEPTPPPVIPSEPAPITYQPVVQQPAMKLSYRVIIEESGNASSVGLSNFEFDLLNAIAKNQGLRFTFQLHKREGIFAQLEQDHADIVSARIDSNTMHGQNWVVTDSYFKDHLGVLSLRDNPVKGYDDLSGRVVSFKKGTPAEKLVRQYNPDSSKYRYAETSGQAVQDLLNGRSEAVVDSNYFLFEQQVKANNLVRSSSSHPELLFAFAVRKTDTKLLEMLNMGLAQVKKDGTYNALRKKHGILTNEAN